MEEKPSRIKEELRQIHSLYNLSRYLFLKIEYNYNAIVEKSGITLPLLRVLWIIKAFPGISLRKIAKIGCWSPPTVTKMLKTLVERDLVLHEDGKSRNLYRLNLSDEGERYIELNRQKSDSNLALFTLNEWIKNEDCRLAIAILKSINKRFENDFIFDYIEKVNALSLKIDYTQFSEENRQNIQELICLYNLLRAFVLFVENNHRQYLTKLEITYPQIRALWIIEAFPGINSAELSTLGFWSPSTANLIVNNLYGKELIYKEKSPVKNSLALYVSPKGETLLVEDFYKNQKRLNLFEVLDFISIQELGQVNSVLYKMNHAVDNKMVDAYIEKTFGIIEKRL